MMRPAANGLARCAPRPGTLTGDAATSALARLMRQRARLQTPVAIVMAMASAAIVLVRLRVAGPDGLAPPGLRERRLRLRGWLPLRPGRPCCGLRVFRNRLRAPAAPPLPRESAAARPSCASACHAWTCGVPASVPYPAHPLQTACGRNRGRSRFSIRAARSPVDAAGACSILSLAQM